MVHARVERVSRGRATYVICQALLSDYPAACQPLHATRRMTSTCQGGFRCCRGMAAAIWFACYLFEFHYQGETR